MQCGAAPAVGATKGAGHTGSENWHGTGHSHLPCPPYHPEMELLREQRAWRGCVEGMVMSFITSLPSEQSEPALARVVSRPGYNSTPTRTSYLCAYLRVLISSCIHACLFMLYFIRAHDCLSMPVRRGRESFENQQKEIEYARKYLVNFQN